MSNEPLKGGCALLPEDARRMLREAAAKKNSILLDNTIAEVKRKYPQFFKSEPQPKE